MKPTAVKTIAILLVCLLVVDDVYATRKRIEDLTWKIVKKAAKVVAKAKYKSIIKPLKESRSSGSKNPFCGMCGQEDDGSRAIGRLVKDAVKVKTGALALGALGAGVLATKGALIAAPILVKSVIAKKVLAKKPIIVKPITLPIPIPYPKAKQLKVAVPITKGAFGGYGGSGSFGVGSSLGSYDFGSSVGAYGPSSFGSLGNPYATSLGAY